MLKKTIEVEVRYSETDRMGFVYYGNYAQYLELARVAVLKEIGISYRELEDKGFLLPVRDFSIQYHRAAGYDDRLSVSAEIREMPTNRIIFDYLLKKEDRLIAEAKTTLIFMNPSGRACRPPQFFLDALLPYFS